METGHYSSGNSWKTHKMRPGMSTENHLVCSAYTLHVITLHRWISSDVPVFPSSATGFSSLRLLHSCGTLL